MATEPRQQLSDTKTRSRHRALLLSGLPVTERLQVAGVSTAELEGGAGAPKLRLYVENAGYPYRDEMIAMMTQYPQLHGDVSTISWVLPRGFLRLPAGTGSGGSGEAGDVRIGSDALAGEDRRSD